MHSKKIIRSLKKKLIESTGVLFSILLFLTAIAFATTSWTSGSAPLAAPGDGNVMADSSWSKNGPDKIFYSSGNVGIGTSEPSVSLEVNGNIIATNPTADNHIATKSYVDAAGGGNTLIDIATTSCDASSDLVLGYDRTTRLKMICDYNGGAGPGWVSVQTTDYSPMLTGSMHNQYDCETTGGATYIAPGSSESMCRFSLSACPSGWTQYQNWSTTLANSCSNYYCGSTCQGGVSGHSWSNTARETCTCPGSYYYYPCCGGAGTCPYCWQSGGYTCSSTITEIGCI